MTATSEFIKTDATLPAPVRMADGARMLARIAKRLIGTSLTIAAVVLWLAPGAVWESDIMLFKLILSLTAVLAGMGLLLSSRAPNPPEIEIDTIRREIRLVRPGKDGRNAVLERCPFGELSRAEREGAHVRLWDGAGRLLAEVTLSDRKAMNSLVAGLQDAGKIA